MAEPDPIERFKYFAVKPQLLESGKTVRALANSDVISCGVQVIAGGGETNLHAHKGNDAIWFVLQGAASFYTTEDRLVATIRKNEGLLIPREVPYWFESTSEENLIILRFGANASGETKGRIDYTPSRVTQAVWVDGAEHLPGTKVLEGAYFGD
jgi:mannose-6-phosphate isomerase-like protein (cupin superfamily)